MDSMEAWTATLILIILYILVPCMWLCIFGNQGTPSELKERYRNDGIQVDGIIQEQKLCPGEIDDYYQLIVEYTVAHTTTELQGPVRVCKKFLLNESDTWLPPPLSADDDEEQSSPQHVALLVLPDYPMSAIPADRAFLSWSDPSSHNDVISTWIAPLVVSLRWLVLLSPVLALIITAIIKSTKEPAANKDKNDRVLIGISLGMAVFGVCFLRCISKTQKHAAVYGNTYSAV